MHEFKGPGFVGFLYNQSPFYVIIAANILCGFRTASQKATFANHLVAKCSSFASAIKAGWMRTFNSKVDIRPKHSKDHHPTSGEGAFPYVFPFERFRLRSLPGFADPPSGLIVLHKCWMPAFLSIEPSVL